jgi:hypothetical protein
VRIKTFWCLFGVVKKNNVPNLVILVTFLCFDLVRLMNSPLFFSENKLDHYFVWCSQKQHRWVIGDIILLAREQLVRRVDYPEQMYLEIAMGILLCHPKCDKKEPKWLYFLVRRLDLTFGWGWMISTKVSVVHE